MKIKQKVIGISEVRLQKSKQHIQNQPTSTEPTKGGTLLYLDKNL